MNERALSSDWTFFSKFVFPPIWISGFGLGAINPWLGLFHGTGSAVPPPAFGFLTVWIVGSAFILWTSAGLKRVRLSGRELLVSNYLREIRIPLDAVIDVSQNRWMNYRPITIQFREPTAFGDHVKFLPKRSFRMQFWRVDPIVVELRQLAGLPDV